MTVSRRHALFGASWLGFTLMFAGVVGALKAGSSEVVLCPMAGPLTLTKTMPRRLATYSSKVVLP